MRRASLLLLLLALGPAPGWSQDAEAQDTDEAARRDVRLSRGQERLASDLKTRERTLDRRERVIAEREQDLKEAEAALRAQMEELKKTKDELQAVLDKIDALTNERLEKLQKTVGSMRDKAAAAMITEMETDLAVLVLDGLNRAAAAAILAKLDPKLAAKLSKLMTNPVEIPKR